MTTNGERGVDAVLLQTATVHAECKDNLQFDLSEQDGERVFSICCTHCDEQITFTLSPLLLKSIQSWLDHERVDFYCYYPDSTTDISTALDQPTLLPSHCDLHVVKQLTSDQLETLSQIEAEGPDTNPAEPAHDRRQGPVKTNK